MNVFDMQRSVEELREQLIEVQQKRANRNRRGSIADRLGASKSAPSDEESTLNVDVIMQFDLEDTELAEEEQNLKEQIFESKTELLFAIIAHTKTPSEHIGCLQRLCDVFAANHCPTFLSDRSNVVIELVENSLKRGKAEEQIAAANLAVILVTQYGGSPAGVQIQRATRKLFIKNLKDNSVSADVREKFAAALGVITFITEGDVFATWDVMENLAAVFTCSCGPLEEVKLPIVSAAEAKVHRAALLSWALLLRVAEEHAHDFIDSHLATVTALLHSAHVELRTAAGEVLALMYEIAREEDSDFEGDDLEDLCRELRSLATDGRKSRAKRQRRMQRASFRPIERAVSDGAAPNSKVRFGRETLVIETWTRKLVYDAICGFLGSGMNEHLKSNPVVRHSLGLGNPTVFVHKKWKRQRPERADAKLRTQRMAKLRDKRMDIP